MLTGEDKCRSLVRSVVRIEFKLTRTIFKISVEQLHQGIFIL
jgi:hypothetical protein